jgi:outer membrane protein
MLRFSAACIAIFCLFSDSTLAQTTWTLQSCIDHAFEHNLQIKQSQLSGERAELNYLSAQGAFLPSLNASASHGYNIGRAIDPFSNDFLENAAIQSNNLKGNHEITA